MDYSIFSDTLESAVGDRDGLGVVRPEHFDGNSDYRVTFSWKLNNDPDRPNKRSRSLIITISQEALENCKDAPEKYQTIAIEKLEELVTARLEEFDPDHNEPHGAEEPTENWLIRSEDIVDY